MFANRSLLLRTSLALVMLSTVLGCILPLAAQTEGTPESAAVYSVPAEHASARATMQTFLQSFESSLAGSGGDSFSEAADCLDLTQIPRLIRATKGAELAVSLKEIIDRVEVIDFKQISDAASAPPYRLPVFNHGDIVISANSRGEWRFDSATVEAIPGLLDATQERAKVEGIVEVDRLPLSMQIRAAVPSKLRASFLTLELWQWIGLASLLVLGWLADIVVVAIFRVLLRRRLLQAAFVVEPGRLAKVLRPVGLVALALVWGAGIHALGLPTGLALVLSRAARLILTVSIVWALYKAIDLATALYAPRASETDSKLDDLLLPLLRKTFKMAVFAFGLVFIADSLNLPITSLVAGLGIGGLALALAAKDTVENFFGSLTVMIDKPFQVGDSVKIDGISGTVTEVGFRSTRIRTFYDSYLTLPNSKLINAAVDNMGERRFRRWSTSIGLAYDTSADQIDAFCAGVRQLVLDHPATRKDGFQVAFKDFGPSSIDIMLYIFFTVPGWAQELEGRQQLALDILRLAEKMEIEIAFPTTTVHLRREEGGDSP